MKNVVLSLAFVQCAQQQSYFNCYSMTLIAPNNIKCNINECVNFLSAKSLDVFFLPRKKEKKANENRLWMNSEIQRKSGKLHLSTKKPHFLLQFNSIIMNSLLTFEMKHILFLYLQTAHKHRHWHASIFCSFANCSLKIVDHHSPISWILPIAFRFFTISNLIMSQQFWLQPTNEPMDKLQLVQ